MLSTVVLVVIVIVLVDVVAVAFVVDRHGWCWQPLWLIDDCKVKTVEESRLDMLIINLYI